MEREDRYFIVKYKDFAKLADDLYDKFSNVLNELRDYLPNRKYVVVESDWPEYEIVWNMIEKRMSGKARHPYENISEENP